MSFTSFTYGQKCHYETLGVPVDASVEEIKRAYRKLCLETHPDTATAKKSSHAKSVNVAKFRQVTEAHSILTNTAKRKQYDLERTSPLKSPSSSSFGGSGGVRGHGSRRNPYAGQQVEFLNGALRPRHLAIGAMLGLTTVTLGKLIMGNDEDKDEPFHTKTGERQNILAWKHPLTGKWHTPAPWDPYYKTLREPKLQNVPRSQVIPLPPNNNK